MHRLGANPGGSRAVDRRLVGDHQKYAFQAEERVGSSAGAATVAQRKRIIKCEAKQKTAEAEARAV